jgi:hypothetical protein
LTGGDVVATLRHMLTAKKFVAACLRLFAFGSCLYLIFMLVTSLMMMGRLPGEFYALFFVWGIASAFLYVYALPLAGVLANDIDRS